MSNNSEFVSSILESCEIKFQLPPVILPGKGVCITDTANMLAESYQDSHAEARLYNRGNAVFCVTRDNNGAMLNALSSQRACSEFELVSTLLKIGQSGLEKTICSPATAKTIISSSTFLNSIPKIGENRDIFAD